MNVAEEKLTDAQLLRKYQAHMVWEAGTKTLVIGGFNWLVRGDKDEQEPARPIEKVIADRNPVVDACKRLMQEAGIEPQRPTEMYGGAIRIHSEAFKELLKGKGLAIEERGTTMGMRL